MGCKLDEVGLLPWLFSPSLLALFCSQHALVHTLGKGDTEVKGVEARLLRLVNVLTGVGIQRPPFSDQKTQVRGQIAELATAVFNARPLDAVFMSTTSNKKVLSSRHPAHLSFIRSLILQLTIMLSQSFGFFTNWGLING